MSSIAMTSTMFSGSRAAAPTPARTRATGASTHLHLTVRGRRVLAGLAALPAAAVLTVAVLAGGSALASAESTGATSTFSTITVMSGDSLWSIAERVAPQADPRDVVDAISRLNALDGAIVSAGQELAIPAEYNPAR